MDRRRVLNLIPGVTGLPSRRAVLRGLAGAGGGLASAPPWGVGRAKRRRKRCTPPCGPCGRCKRGRCRPRLPDGTLCAAGACQGGRCVGPACGAGGPCRVFLSSALYTGALGGLASADAKCQALAEAAGLPGEYKAWLADATGAPSARFVRSGGPYVLVDGTTVAANWADLTDGQLLAPIAVTETGGGPGTVTSVWTHTLTNGNRGDGVSCVEWTYEQLPNHGDAGRADLTDARWTDAGFAGCNSPCHLYCFQQR